MAPRKPGEQARRDARARDLGYRSDYDYRIHDFGRIAPDLPAPTGVERRRLRGHTSLADLLRELEAGNVELLTVQGVRGARGRYTRVDFLASMKSGQTIEFTLSGPRAFTDDTVARIRAAIADSPPGYVRVVGSPPGLVSDITEVA